MEGSTSLSRDAEVRVTSATGGQKGKKLARFSLVPPDAMKEVAEVYGRGAEKYEARNWERGYEWGLSIDALERHVNAFKAGAKRDELGNHHLACAVFHALALITWEMHNLGTDDRTKVNGRISGPSFEPVPAPSGSGHGEHVLGSAPEPIRTRSKSALWAERVRASVPSDTGGGSSTPGVRGLEATTQGEEDPPLEQRDPRGSSGRKQRTRRKKGQ